MIFGCDDISKLLQEEDEIEQVSKQAGDVAGKLIMECWYRQSR